jgi:hypothetical protein
MRQQCCSRFPYTGILPRMNRKCNDVLVLEMDLPRQVVRCRFAGTVGRVRKGDLIQTPDRPDDTADDDEFRILGLFQQREGCLKHPHRTDGVYLEMILQVRDSHLRNWLIGIRGKYSCISDDGVELVDALAFG